MSENPTTQAQQITSPWQRAVDDHVARVEQAYGEAARLEREGTARTQVALDEMARLTKETFGYFTELSAEWRKLSLEATRNAASFFAPRG